jgi:hypothetical protein
LRHGGGLAVLGRMERAALSGRLWGRKLDLPGNSFGFRSQHVFGALNCESVRQYGERLLDSSRRLPKDSRIKLDRFGGDWHRECVQSSPNLNPNPNPKIHFFGGPL